MERGSLLLVKLETGVEEQTLKTGCFSGYLTPQVRMYMQVKTHSSTVGRSPVDWITSSVFCSTGVVCLPSVFIAVFR